VFFNIYCSINKKATIYEKKISCPLGMAGVGAESISAPVSLADMESAPTDRADMESAPTDRADMESAPTVFNIT